MVLCSTVRGVLSGAELMETITVSSETLAALLLRQNLDPGFYVSHISTVVVFIA